MFITNNINYYNNYNNRVNHTRKYGSFGLSKDTVSFGSAKRLNSDQWLKRISGLHDPYSDIVMVSDDDYDKYMKKVKKSHNTESMIKLLGSYEKNLFEPEKEALEIISENYKNIKKRDPKRAKNLDLHDLLDECYLCAHMSLKREQLSALGRINAIISKANETSKSKLTEIFEPVKESIEDDSFRISPLLAKIYETKGVDRRDKRLVLKEMEKFPNSRSSADVFIVTNAHKTHEEIAEAFITPSRVSIEHIRPQSCGGRSCISNYLIASRRMNSIRSSMPLDEFIMKHPEVPKCTERYFCDVVDKVNKGGLPDLGMHLPAIAKTLYKESKGTIDLEIGGISPSKRAEIDELKAILNDLVKKYC